MAVELGAHLAHHLRQDVQLFGHPLRVALVPDGREGQQLRVAERKLIAGGADLVEDGP